MIAGLSHQERTALGIIQQNGSVTQTHLARALGMGAARVNGFMYNLSAKLREIAEPHFDSQKLPSGEMQYECVGGEKSGQ